MIFLTEGNIPLNAAYDDNIVQEANSTYQLTFKFPTNNILWQRLREEAFLTADDLHGEQDFVIFEVEKKHGYIQVYANQVMTLLNNYVVNPISLDRQTGSTALSRFAGSITRDNPFSFFSDIEDRYTFNIDAKNAMDAFAKDKHSILGQWGGDLVRHGYQVRLLKNGGSENESLFMYKKNLSSYQHKTSTKSLKTRITFKTTVKGEGEKAPDRKFSVVVDSPLINKYSQIYEDVIEVNDEDVKDEASLRKYGEQYFKTSLCDMMEDGLELEVVGQSDVPVQMYDIVSLFHEVYNLDVRKKITKYTYSPMAKKLISIGFGQFKSGLANAIESAVSDAVKNETQHLQGQFATQLAKEIKNADLDFDRKKEELVNQITDGLNAAKAKAEEDKRQLSDTIDKRFSSFNNGPLQEVKRKADEALRNVGASSLLAQEAKQISERARADITKLKNEVVDGYVGKNTYQEDIRGIERRIEEVKTSTDSQVTTKIAQFKQSVDGRFSNISSQLDGKANLLDFQRVQETSKLYERIIGRSESDIADKVARMALTNQLFQVEVAKASAGGRNLFLNSLFKRDLHQRYSTYHVDDSVEQTQGQLALSIDENTKFRGANTLKIVSTFNGKPNNQKVTFRTGGDMRLNTADEMRNKSVRFSFWAKSTVNNTNFQARAGYRNTVEGVSLTTDWKFYDIQLTKSENSNASNEVIMHVFTAATVWIAFPKVEIGTVSTDFSEAPEDTDAAIRTVQSQLAGSWSVQNLTSAGAIISQINATNNQILIEAEKIRLKGKTLLDELTAIDGYFKRLFVGEGNFAKLNAEIIGSRTITADKLIMDQAMARMFVSSDIFTDTLAAKEAFINKLRSVVVSATLLEGYKGKIGGFQIGTHDKDPHTYWITGSNSFMVGMGDVGVNNWDQTALWVNWGDDWSKPGKRAWYVNARGEMFCNNDAVFHDVVTFSSESVVKFYGVNSFYKNIYMRDGTEIYGTGSTPRSTGQNAVVWWNQIGDGTVKYWIDRVSDRRLKRNIVDTDVNAIDRINQLKMVAFDFIKTGKHEEIGLIAQEVEAILPSAISKNPEKKDDYLHIDYVAIVPYLIKAIQELNQKIEKLEKTA